MAASIAFAMRSNRFQRILVQTKTRQLHVLLHPHGLHIRESPRQQLSGCADQQAAKLRHLTKIQAGITGAPKTSHQHDTMVECFCGSDSSPDPAPTILGEQRTYYGVWSTESSVRRPYGQERHPYIEPVRVTPRPWGTGQIHLN